MAQQKSNIKYNANFVGIDGAQRELQIIDATSTFVTKNITLTGLTLEENNTEEIFEPLRTWTGNVSFYSNGVTLADITPKNSRGLQVKILKGSEVEFVGYVSGESLSQSYSSRGEVLSFNVVSRLGVGSGLEYDETQSVSTSNILTLGQLLYDCLKQCGVEDSDYIYLCDSVLLTADTDSPWRLFASQVDRYRFYKENSDKTINKDYTAEVCGTIVTEILRPFGFLMHERGEKIIITHTNINNYTTYRMIALPMLAQLDEVNTVYELSEQIITHTIEDAGLYTTDQKSDFYRGAKKFRVTLNFGNQEIDVFKRLLDYDNYDYNSALYRYWGEQNIYRKNVSDIIYFEPQNKKYSGVRCYPYKLTEDTTSSEGVKFVAVDDLSTWTNNQRPGCTLIRYKDVPSADLDRDIFISQNTGDSWSDGFIINPSQYQRPTGSNKNKIYISGVPLIKVETQKEYMLYGGKFVLGMTLSHHTYPDDNGGDVTNPGKKGFILCDRFAIGNNYFAGGHNRGGDVWQNTPKNIGLYITGGDTGDAQLEKDTTATGEDIYYHSGTKALPHDDEGNPTKLFKGKISWALYLGGPMASETTGVEQTFVPLKTGGVILSNLSLSYDVTTPNKRQDEQEKKSTREYYKDSTNGFDGEEKSVTTMLGSYAKDAGLALSNIFYKEAPLTEIYNGLKQVVIEEDLVQRLKLYYDRICEVRTLKFKDDGTKYYAGEFIQTSDGEWLVLATSVDYLNGTRQLTLTQIVY